MPFDPQRHHRRSVRLRGFDYGGPGAYFVTLCTRRRAPIFGRVAEDDVRLTACGAIAADEWRRIAVVRPYVRLDAFVVMPDHLHGLLVLPGGAGAAARAYGAADAGSLPAILRQYKSVVTKRIRLLPGMADVSVWQRNYWERIVRTPDEFRAVRRYIQNNPRARSRDHPAPRSPPRHNP